MIQIFLKLNDKIYQNFEDEKYSSNVRENTKSNNKINLNKNYIQINNNNEKKLLNNKKLQVSKK